MDTQKNLPDLLEKSLAQLEKQAQIAHTQSISLKKIVSDIRAKSSINNQT